MSAAPPLTFNAWLRWDLISRWLPRPIGSILEIGCGMGALGSRLAARASAYVGIEPDETSRATAVTRLPRVVTDIEDTAGTIFDVVCAFEVLEHIEDDRKALTTWVERLKPGGTLLLSVPAFQKRYAAADVMAGHFRRYEPEALAALLRDVGLTDVEVRVYGGPLGYLLEAGRNLVGKRVVAKRKDASIADRTSGSGRLLQPPQSFGALTQAATAPFRLLQRRMPNTGVGLIARARRPE